MFFYPVAERAVPIHRSLGALILLALGVLAACRTTDVQAPAWAYGLTLGDVLDKTTAQPMDAMIAGRGLFRVRPPKPHRDFEDYALITDRATGRMIGIVGWDRFSSGDACQREREALAKVVERRYGPGAPAKPADREAMKGLPESLNSPDLTMYSGYQGPVALGCAGPRLLLAYWFTPPDAPPPAESAPPAPEAGAAPTKR
jgi:hypothetical protein